MNKEINGEMINIPEHVAIIMDGNGRWAKKRLMPRTYGHSEGAKAIERTCENADELGIKYLTVYAFSTENWKRSVEEVSTIMNIFRKYLVDSIERSNRNNMRVRIIGKREDLPEDIVEKMYNLEKATANNTGLQFSVAINYGGRDEILHAAKLCAAAGEEMTEENLEKHLYSAGIPDPELIIRPGGELRLSNFLLWQAAYAELFFTPVLWPDFTEEDFAQALDEYARRERRFGLVKNNERIR